LGFGVVGWVFFFGGGLAVWRAGGRGAASGIKREGEGGGGGGGGGGWEQNVFLKLKLAMFLMYINYWSFKGLDGVSEMR